MITLKEGKPQEIEVSVSYKGIPYEKEVSFGVLADGELVFNENYTPENGTITVMLPPGDTTKQYSYILESDDGFTKEQPIEVYAPKMREIEAKKQYLDIDIDKTWDENTDALLGAYNEVYAESRGKVDELDKGLKDVRETSESKAEEIYEYILEDVVPIITELKSQQESTKSSHESILEEHSSLTNEIKESLGSFETKEKIDQKLANIYRDISDVRGYTDTSLKPLLKEIKMIKGDTSLQSLGRSLNTLQQSVKNELEEMKKTMSQGRNIQPFFSTIAVAGQNTLEPQGPFDALTLAEGSNITLTTDRLTRTVTIASTGGGGGGTPGGNDTNIQYNNAGSFAGSDKFTRNNTSTTLRLGVDGTSQAVIQGAVGIGANSGTSLVLQGGAGDVDGGSVFISAGEGGSGDAGQVALSDGTQSMQFYLAGDETAWVNAVDQIYKFGGGSSATYRGILDFSNLTDHRTYTLQDGDGTLAFLSDITGGGTPGGSDTQVQYNDGGAFGAEAGFTYNKTTNVLTAGDEVRSSTISTNIIQGYNFGSGSYLSIHGGDYGTGSGNGETVQVNGGAGGTTGGNGGEMIYSGGAAQAGNGNGGNISFFGGAKHGSGTVGKFRFHSGDSTLKYAYLDFESIATSDKTFTFPNTTGTIALTSDIKPLTTVTDSGTSLTLAGVTTTIKTYVFTGASTATWTLQAVSGNTDVGVICKNRGTANINLNRAGSDNIYYNSAITSLTIYPGESYTVVNDGTYRLIV